MAENLKQCYVFYSLFPKDREFNKCLTNSQNLELEDNWDFKFSLQKIEDL
jgi:hypothetical protein